MEKGVGRPAGRVPWGKERRLKPLLSAEEMRACEADAVRGGVSTLQLMERAGVALAEHAQRMAGPEGRFAVLCGPGNNGGDGLVAARHLAKAGRQVLVVLLAEATALKGESRTNLEALTAMGGSAGGAVEDFAPRPGDVAIDALLGTGLNRAPDGALADAIHALWRWRAVGVRVLSADVPSGLASDTGAAFRPTVQADATLAFGALKVGEALEPGASLSGELHLAPIGLEPEAPSVQLLEEEDARGWLPQRRADSNKGTYGHVLVVAGSRGKSGAAALAGLASLRSGVGLCTVATPEDALSDVLGHAPELMGVGLDSDKPLGPVHLEALLEAAEGKDALVVGPGIARGKKTHLLLAQLLERFPGPVVLDADALNAVAGRLEVLRAAQGTLVLTPHPGEMARLCGLTAAEIQADRVAVAKDFARAHRVVLVLKGARTVVASPDGRARINPTGNPGMATGGTGDVLSGICGALLAQGIAPLDAASAAVYAHGLAGDLEQEWRGDMGLIASDLLAGLTAVWARWNR
jgi:ADP-dependent NAD(P)H-hydrate dehydratase / NAD(P)H-hydrate epimerase